MASASYPPFAGQVPSTIFEINEEEEVVNEDGESFFPNDLASSNGDDSFLFEDPDAGPADPFLCPEVTLGKYDSIECVDTVDWLNLFVDVITSVIHTQVTKTFYPGIVEKESLQAIEHNALEASSLLRKVLAVEIATSSAVVYNLIILLRGHAEDLGHFTECLYQYRDDNCGEEAYYTKLFRLNDCSYWHTGALCNDVCTIDGAHQVLFYLDFYFNIMKADHITDALAKVEAFMSKLYGSTLTIYPHLLNMDNVCADCVVQDALDYKLPDTDQGDCTDLCTIDSDETVPGVDDDTGGADYVAEVANALGIDDNGFSVYMTSGYEKESAEKRFYSQLNKEDSSTYTTKRAKQIDRNIIFQKAMNINSDVRQKQLHYDSKWKDARDVMFHLDKGILDDKTRMLYTMPIFGLDAHELINNHKAMMEDRLLQLADEEETYIKEMLSKSDSCIKQKIVGSRTENLTQLIDEDTGNEIEDGLNDIIRSIASKSVDNCITEAHDTLVEQYRVLINRKIANLQERVSVVYATLKRLINPSVPSYRLMELSHGVYRAMIAKTLFSRAAEALAHSDSIPVVDNIRKVQFIEKLTGSVEKHTVGHISEQIKHFSLGPVYLCGDEHLLMRKGFTLHTVWVAQAIAADCCLNFKQFCELKDIAAHSVGGILSFNTVITRTLEKYDKFVKVMNDGDNGGKYDTNQYFIGYLHKIRLAVCVTVAYNQRAAVNPLSIHRHDCHQNIISTSDREAFRLENGLYIRDVFSPYTLVYDDQLGRKNVFSSYDIMEVCFVHSNSNQYMRGIY